jgi:pre-mRNA-processing factor SLU7
MAGASLPLARVQEVKSFSSKGKASVRDLRIREDTAKYLLNLDVESAFYDPKSRCV